MFSRWCAAIIASSGTGLRGSCRSTRSAAVRARAAWCSARAPGAGPRRGGDRALSGGRGRCGGVALARGAGQRTEQENEREQRADERHRNLGWRWEWS